MSLEPVIGIDLGPLVVCCALGTSEHPQLLRDPAGAWELRECQDEKAALSYVAELIGRRGRCYVAMESTFTEKRRKHLFKADVGRNQEGQARYLTAKLEDWPEVIEVLRVQPQTETDGFAAWCAFGRPTLRGPSLGVHKKDSLAAALAGIVLLEDRRKEPMMEAVG